MKYLLPLLHSLPPPPSPPSAPPKPQVDLKSLFTEIREATRAAHGAGASGDRSERARDDEWAESLERIVAELRASEYATAFLKPVRKMEAPDYYTVIQNPMDLSTLSKKIKTRSYPTKAQFAADLDLIWSNCLLYNTEPTHPLRAHATHLRGRSKQLLEFVPDAPGEDEDVLEQNAAAAAAAARGGKRGVKGGGGAGAKKRRMGGGDAEVKMEGGPPSPSASPPPPTPGAPLPSTSKAALPFPDTPALLRPAELVPLEPSPDDDAAVVAAEDEDWSGVLDNKWWASALGEASITRGLPAAPRPSSSPPPPSPPSASHPPRRKRPRRSALSQNHLPTTFAANLSTLRELRKTHARLNALANADPAADPDLLPRLLASDGEEDEGAEAGWGNAMWAEMERPARGAVGEREAEEAMRRVGVGLLSHAGFEGSSEGALNVLVQVGAQYLSNLGQTLRYYSDGHGKDMSPEEIILHSLYENGNVTPGSLQKYVQDDVGRYGAKLADLSRKLKDTLRERLDASKGFIEDDAFFAEDGDQLVAGGWTEDLGEDFFGFRELGLDKELGMSTLSVPSRLFRGGAKRAGAGAGGAGGAGASKDPALPYPPPPPFVPLASPSQTIGLLRPYFAARPSLADDSPLSTALAKPNATPSAGPSARVTSNSNANGKAPAVPAPSTQPQPRIRLGATGQVLGGLRGGGLEEMIRPKPPPPPEGEVKRKEKPAGTEGVKKEKVEKELGSVAGTPVVPPRGEGNDTPTSAPAPLQTVRT